MSAANAALNRPLRVAFIDFAVEPTRPGRSGLSDVVWDMAAVLADEGHEVHAIGSYHTDRFPDSRVTVHNFPTPPIGYRNLLGHIWIIKRAASVTHRLRPDIVHAMEYMSTAVFATLRVPAPLVLTVPGNIFARIEQGHSYEWHHVQALKWAARVSARRCASVIAVSQDMKRWWERTGSTPERTPWITAGADARRFGPVAGAREKLGIRPDSTFLLYAGRLAKEKGLLDLVAALAKAVPATPAGSLDVALIGKGQQEEALRAAIAAAGLEGVVRLVAWVPQDELPTWYSAADALLLPSYSEGFSRTIVEAMNCGTPIIGSRITGTEDHVHEGTNGFLFPAGDVDQLAAILTNVARDRSTLTRLRESSLAYARENLTWQKIVPRIVSEVYRPNLITADGRSR